MDRNSGGVLGRLGVLVVGLLVLALSAAPVALAQSQTDITAAATVQFSGEVDQDPSCTDDPTIIVNWGDNTPVSDGAYDASGNVTATHTYAASGTYNGTVAFRGDDCAATDDFTATVEPAPQFKQCPPVDADFGCQFLIVVSNGGATIEQDSNQGPYESSDDALIGIENNSSDPITSIPLASPGTDLFGFDEDGLCDAGALPVPSGCVPQAGAPAGETCGEQQDGSCSFPAPAGEPAGYVEPGAVSPYRQNGYEGPTTWFSNVSADTSSGQVNFSPPLQPGQSTYFSLEEPPSAASLNASASPTGLSTSPPSVTSTGADFSGLVDPNGSATTAFFQYGLDPKYGRASAGPYSQSTPPQAIGGDFASHLVSASASGLVPNALYHVRLVATNQNGTTFGPDMTFTTGRLASPTTPTIAKNFNASVASGLILVKVNGKWVPLTELRQFPDGTEIDALGGTLRLVTATGTKHKTYSGLFGGAIFKVSQTRSGSNKGLTTLAIVEGAFTGAPSYASCKAKAAVDDPTAHAALSSRILQTLRASASGRFRTRGRYAAGTVRGTQWNTIDRCNGTGIHVITHSVLVTDLVKHINILVKAGHTYLAKPK